MTVQVSRSPRSSPSSTSARVTMNGVSKAYCMTAGDRLWRAAGPADQAMRSCSRSRPPTHSISQRLHRRPQRPAGLHRRAQQSFRERRDLVFDMSEQGARTPLPPAEGRVLRLPSCAGAIGKRTPARQEIKTDDDFVDLSPGSGSVAAVQGSAFGLSPFFRISTPPRPRRARGLHPHPRACSALR